MRIVRCLHNRKDSILIDPGVVWDTRLSSEALAFLLKCYSLPTDTTTTIGDVAKKSGLGRKRLRRILDELEVAAYISEGELI